MRHRGAIRPLAPDTKETYPAMVRPPDREDAEDRVRTIELRPGVVWRIRMVARLVREDIMLGTHTACLIVRLERPGLDESKGDLLTTLRADSLEEVPEAQLHSLLDRYGTPRRRSARG